MHRFIFQLLKKQSKTQRFAALAWYYVPTPTCIKQPIKQPKLAASPMKEVATNMLYHRRLLFRMVTAKTKVSKYGVRVVSDKSYLSDVAKMRSTSQR